MKLLSCLFVLLCGISSVHAQHALQLDGGPGRIGVLRGNLLPIGVTDFEFPAVGGTLLTTGSLGTLVWQVGGNLGTSPNNYLGTLDDVNLNLITGSGGPVTRMSIDADGDVGIGFLPTFGTNDSKLQVERILTTDPGSTINTQSLQLNLTPTSALISQINTLHFRTNIFNSASNISTVADGIRGEVITFSNYTGVLDYAQGGNFNIEHGAPTLLANADAAIGSIYLNGVAATNGITNARGTAGQVFNLGPGTIANAYGSWNRIGNVGGGAITNASLFYGVNPGSPGITNLTGYYMEQLTSAFPLTARAFWYAHATRPVVITANSEVSIGNASPTVGIPLSIYPGSSGSTILRLNRTAAGQLLSTEYNPLAPLSASNVLWGTGMLNFAPNANYSIWSNDGVSTFRRFTIDPEGQAAFGAGFTPTTGVYDPMLTVYQLNAADPASPVYNQSLIQDIIPTGVWTTGIDNLHIRSIVANSANNLNTVVDGIRAEVYTFGNYTGTLSYAQGGNFNILHQAPTTLGFADACIGSTYLQGAAPSLIANARGIVGQVQNLNTGTITNALAVWGNIANGGGGNITNAFLFFGSNPNSASINLLTGLYLEGLSGPALNNTRAIWYNHATRPFVVMGNGEVGVGNATPPTGITMSLYPGSSGSTILRLNRTGAGQYLSTDYQPNGAITAANPRWGSGMMGGAFPNLNYSIWTFNGAIDNPRLTIDPEGEVGIGITATPGVANPKLNILTDQTADGGLSYNATAITHNLSPTTAWTSAINNLYQRTNIFTSANNLSTVVDGIRQEIVTFGDYTGTLDYAQGGNFSIIHQAPTTAANIDGVLGSVYLQGSVASNVVTNARGTVGQIFNQGPGNVTNAYGSWNRIGNFGVGTIDNAYLFYGVNTSTIGFTNLTGLYLEQLTGATNINAMVYAHATAPFVLTGDGNMGIGTATPVTNARLSVKDGHLQSQQTTAPASAVGANNLVGAVTLNNATDMAGSITIVLGVTAFTGSQADVTFDKPFVTAPIIVISPADGPTAQAMSPDAIYVTATTTGFSIQAVNPTVGGTYILNYHVIETQ